MESHTFTAAVRGYHYYRRFWRPKENKKLICLHEPGNTFDRFAINTMNENEEIFGHLPKEISRITKYFLDRDASMYCTLSSEHYRRFPLVPGGLEIECQIVIETRATMLQARLTRPYLDLVRIFTRNMIVPCTEPTEDRGIENLFNFFMTLYSCHTACPSQNKDKVRIHYCFKEWGYLRNARITQEE